MGVTLQINKIYKDSEAARENFPNGVPTMHDLLDTIYEQTEWSKDTPANLWDFLKAMQEYSFKHAITDFYEMVLRFTLSECFNEDI